MYYYYLNGIEYQIISELALHAIIGNIISPAYVVSIQHNKSEVLNG